LYSSCFFVFSIQFFVLHFFFATLFFLSSAKAFVLQICLFSDGQKGVYLLLSNFATLFFSLAEGFFFIAQALQLFFSSAEGFFYCSSKFLCFCNFVFFFSVQIFFPSFFNSAAE